MNKRKEYNCKVVTADVAILTLYDGGDVGIEIAKAPTLPDGSDDGFDVDVVLSPADAEDFAYRILAHIDCAKEAA